MTMSLYVGNLPYSTDDAALEKMFTSYGDVTSARVMTDRETGRSRGFGFVEMEAEHAREAMKDLDQSDQGGRKLRVNEAEKRNNRY